MKQIPFRHFLPGISWFVLVLILICLPKSGMPNLNGWFNQIHGDKWVHGGLFGVLAWLFFRPFHQTEIFTIQQKRNYYLWISFLTISWGYITECIQLYVPGRSYDLWDWGADSLGVIFALILNRLRIA